MAYSYKGSISFGLVYIPIKLEAAAKETDISFNQLEKTTKSRVRYKKTCEDCDGKTIENKDIVKAYEYEDGKYVIFDDEDFEKIKNQKDKSIVIEQFVTLSDIDPVYYNKTYYVVPTGAEKAYSLLLAAMKNSNKVGIAKTVLGQKETIIALRENNGEMLITTLYFADEIKNSTAKIVNSTVSKNELDMAETIIKGMSRKLDITTYKNEYNEKIKRAIESKIAGQEITSPKEKHNNVMDLMEALKLSVQNLNTNTEKTKNVKNNKTTEPEPASKSPVKKNSNKNNIINYNDIKEKNYKYI